VRRSSTETSRTGPTRRLAADAGGTDDDPTYHALGDHTEVVRVDYDPDRLSCADLLGRAFDSHDPQTQTAETQYQNLVFTASETQHQTLVAYLDSTGRRPETIATRVEPLSEFHLAEDYHQKYRLRADAALVDAFEAAGYDDAAIRESPAAATLNGLAAGHDIAADDPLRVALERAPDGA
jgi:peptide-methionine (S)-S-oxide reductase